MAKALLSPDVPNHVYPPRSAAVTSAPVRLHSQALGVSSASQASRLREGWLEGRGSNLSTVLLEPQLTGDPH